MRVPLSWLKEYVEIGLPVEELSERLTLAGLEVEAIERIGDWWDRSRIVVGEVLEVRPHPNADRLVLVDVAYGRGAVEQCVTGAPNLFPFLNAGRVSLKVAFAMEGAELYDGHREDAVKMRLKASKIRGVPSRAMVCSEKELGISDEHEGILFLPSEAPVGAPLSDYLGDAILDIAITPNMARCLGVVAVAREVAALTHTPLLYPDVSCLMQGPPVEALARVSIHDPDLCPRYIAAIIQSVRTAPSPRWMQDRVRKAGMRPINNIVDITNYVMLEWGQPLHAFDYDKLVARAGTGVPEIIVRRSTPGESITTLDGAYRVLAEETLLICDTAGPIAIAGVMGGAETEIGESTHRILLESADFDLTSIRRTTQALRLPSEASYRFGRGIHPAQAERAAGRASELMRELAGGVVANGMVDAYPRPAPVVTIDLDMREVGRCLGVALGVPEAAELLGRLEFCTDPVDATLLRVIVPDHRLDCQLPADLIEELARMHGYDRIPVRELADLLPPQRGNPGLELEETVRDILVGCGLQEVVTYGLTTTAREAALLPGTGARPDEAYVALLNPLNPERSVMRRRLLATVLEIAAPNLRRSERVALFEVGKVFLPEPGHALPHERLQLCLAMAGVRNGKHWLTQTGPDLGFFDLKGVIETLLERLCIGGAEYEPVLHPTYQPGRTARLSVRGTEVGVLGELGHATREACELGDRRVAAAELDLDVLLSCVPSTRLVQPVSSYPAVLHDLAVVVDDAVPSSRVEGLITKAGGPLLKQVRLFDVYKGPPIPAGKKSLAFALAFQAPDKTLTDDLVARLVRRVVASLSKEVGAELRS